MRPSSSAYTSNSQPMTSSMLRFQFVEFLTQDRDLLGLFKENCQQSGLEGQQRLSLGDGCNMPARGRKESVEDVLVTSAQGAAEGRQQALGLVKMLGDGDNGATHSVKCEVSGFRWSEGRGSVERGEAARSIRG